jgi:hypothetical protein
LVSIGPFGDADQDGGVFKAVFVMSSELPPPSLTHLNASGEVHMVEVGERPSTRREARAEGCIRMQCWHW